MAGGLTGLDGQQGKQDAFGFDHRKIIIRPGFNPRPPEEVRANVARLKPLIAAAKGVIQPILLGKDGDEVYLIAGETRVTAMLELIAEGVFADEVLPNGDVKLVTVPALYRRAATDEKQRLLDALFENEGQPISEWSKGAAYARFMDLGWDEAQIASKVGRDVREIRAALKLAEAPQAARELLAEGKVTAGSVLSAIKHKKVGELVERAKTATAPVKREKADSALTKALNALLKEAQEELTAEVEPEWVTVSTKSVKRLMKAMGRI